MIRLNDPIFERPPTRPLMKLTSKRSISNRDESDDMPSDEDEPRSDVVRDRTSIWSCRQYSSDRSLSLRS